MDTDIKLTLRLPRQLHAALRVRAGRRHRSVNREIVDTLARGLAAVEALQEQDRDAVAGLLVAAGVWEPGQLWRDDPSPAAVSSPDYAALRRVVGGGTTLSDAIIEDRGPA